MKRWLLLVPFLMLPLACDQNSTPTAMPSSAASSGTAAACQVAAGNCTVDSDCCSGLVCNHDKSVCQDSNACSGDGGGCRTSGDCCGSLSCNGGTCSASSTQGAKTPVRRK